MVGPLPGEIQGKDGTKKAIDPYYGISSMDAGT